MKFTLLTIAFLTVMLAVSPIMAYTPHSVYDIHLTKGVTYHFGSSHYIMSSCDIVVTSLWTAENATANWLNFTIPVSPPFGVSLQEVYSSQFNATMVYYNGVADTDFSYEYGLVITYPPLGSSYPCYVSIAYGAFVPPSAEYNNLLIRGFDNVTGEEIFDVPLTMYDNNLSAYYTLYTGTPISIANNTSITLTCIDTSIYWFSNWTSTPPTTPYVTFYMITDVTISVYYWEWQPAILIPIIFIIGIVGISLMFIGPLYAIHSFMKKEYMNAMKWGIILTILGVALFIAWLWGGSFG